MPADPEFTAEDRRALRAIAVQFFVNGALFASFIPRLPEIRDRVGITVSTIGLLLSLAGLAGLLGSAVASPAVSRFGTRRLMIGAGTIVSISLAVVGLATTPALLLVGLVGMLTFDVMVDISMNMQGSWLSARRHAPVMNRLHGLWSLGTLLGGAISSWLAAAGVSLTTHLISAAAVLFGCLLYVGTGVLRVDQPPVEHAPGTSGAARAPLVVFTLAGFFAVAMESTSIEWSSFRMADDFGVGAGFAALGYVAVTGGMTAARFAADTVGVWIGVRRLTEVALVLAGGGLALASLVENRYVALFGFLLAGLGIAPLLPGLYDAAVKRPGRQGAGLGALTAGLRIGTVSVPLIVGGLAGTELSVGTAIAVVTLPSAVGYWFVAVLLPTRARPAR